MEDGGQDPEVLCERIMAEVADVSGRDDTAVLALGSLPLEGDELTLQLPTDPASLRAARRVLTRWLERVGAGKRVAGDIALACYEGCTNAARHGHRSREEPFALEATHSDGEVTLIVRDRGGWREPRPSDFGKGLILMRELMDEVDVDSGPDGTVVRMRRRLDEPA